MTTALSLEGPITFSTVLSRMDELGSYFSTHDGQNLEINFSQVSEVDSTAVALMLHWLRIAQALRISLQFSGLPIGLAKLLEVYGLAKFIKFV